MTPLQPRKEIRKLKAIGFFSVSVCLRMSGKALHSELELECSKRNSSRNKFFAIFEVRVQHHFFVIFGKFGIEQFPNVPNVRKTLFLNFSEVFDPKTGNYFQTFLAKFLRV